MQYGDHNEDTHSLIKPTHHSSDIHIINISRTLTTYQRDRDSLNPPPIEAISTRSTISIALITDKSDMVSSNPKSDIFPSILKIILSTQLIRRYYKLLLPLIMLQKKLRDKMVATKVKNCNNIFSRQAFLNENFPHSEYLPKMSGL